jgi:hypothetical protein
MFLHFTSYQFQHHHQAGLTFCVKLLCFLSLFDSFAHYTVGKVHHAILYTTINTTYIRTSEMIVKVVKAMRYIYYCLYHHSWRKLVKEAENVMFLRHSRNELWEIKLIKLG